MSLMMSKLNIPIPEYDPDLDPIFAHATQLHAVETHTHSTAELRLPDSLSGSVKVEKDDESAEVKRPSDQEQDVDNRKKLCDGLNNSEEKQIGNCEGKLSSQSVMEDEKNVSSTVAENVSSSEETACVEVEGNDVAQVVVKEEPCNEGSSCVQVKKEPENSESSNQIKEEPKPDVQKSPTKGIWRPFSFDDIENCPSSSGVAQFLEVKTEPFVNNPNSSKFSVSPLNFKPDSCNTNSKYLLHEQNAVKKCSIQLEPLDLSCARKNETERENPYFCKYCRVHYHSGFCLFYRKMSSEVPPDPPCYCCDEEEEKDPLSPEADGKTADELEKTAAKVPITNPGWFGKGCRKKIRKKR